jgi:hypothetical protein
MNFLQVGLELKYALLGRMLRQDAPTRRFAESKALRVRELYQKAQSVLTI